MRVIGSRSPVNRARSFTRASAGPEEFGAGVGAALQNLGAATQELGISQIQLNEEMKRRAEKQRRSNLDIEYLRWEGEQNRRLAEQRAMIEPGAPDLTERTFAEIGASFEEFAARTGLSEEDRLHYGERFERFRQTTTTQAFAVEFEEQNRLFIENVTSYIDDARHKIRENPQVFEREFADITAIIEQSDIPPLMQEDLKQRAYEALAGTVFQSEVEAAQRDDRPIRDWRTGNDVVAPGLSAPARAFLNAMSGPESRGSYTAMYPNTSFDNGFVDHPRVRSVIQPRGQRSRPVRQTSGPARGTAAEEATQQDTAERGEPMLMGVFGARGEQRAVVRLPSGEMVENVPVRETDDGFAVEGYGIAPGVAQNITPLDVDRGSQGTLEQSAPPQRPRGLTSDAAGRYMFLSSTWDYLVREMNAQGYNITDFSPVNQDRVAWYYAQKSYRERTGRDLESDIASGDRQVLAGVRRHLTHKWEGLGDITDDEWINAITGVQGLSGGGTGRSEAPDPWSDPRFAGLDFDTKMALEQQGAAAVAAARKAEIEARQQQEQTLYENIRRAFSDMDANASRMAEQAIQTGAITDIKLVEGLRGLYQKERDEIASAGNVAGRIATGDVFTAGDRQGLNDFARQSGLDAGIRNREPEAAVGLRETFDATGFIPTDILDVLQSQLTSASAETQLFAMQTLADLYEHNPRAFAAMNEELARDAAFKSTLFQMSEDPRVALENYNTMRGPQGAQARRVLMEQAAEVIEDQGPTEFFRQATSWWARNLPGFEHLTGTPRPRIPSQPRDAMLFTDEYSQIFKTYYAMFGGDEKMAHEAAGRMMSFAWHPSPTTGEMLKHSPMAPKMGVPTVDGTYQWIEPQMRRQTGLEGDLLIRSDAQTIQDLAQTGVPSYQIVTRTDLGEFLVHTERWSAEPDEFTRSAHEREMRARNLEERASSLEGAVRSAITPFGDRSGLPEVTQNLQEARRLRIAAEEVRSGGEGQDTAARLRAEIETLEGQLARMSQSGGPGPRQRIESRLNQLRRNLRIFEEAE